VVTALALIGDSNSIARITLTHLPGLKFELPPLKCRGFGARAAYLFAGLTQLIMEE